MQQNLPSDRDIEEFDKLPFERKWYFVTQEHPNLKSAIYMPEFREKEVVGDAYKKGHLFYKHLVEKIYLHFSKEIVNFAKGNRQTT